MPNISRSKDNQAMKFGQLLDIAGETFFLKNHAQNVAEKVVPDPFLKTKIEHISGSIVKSFILYAKLRVIKIF